MARAKSSEMQILDFDIFRLTGIGGIVNTATKRAER